MRKAGCVWFFFEDPGGFREPSSSNGFAEDPVFFVCLSNTLLDAIRTRMTNLISGEPSSRRSSLTKDPAFSMLIKIRITNKPCLPKNHLFLDGFVEAPDYSKTTGWKYSPPHRFETSYSRSALAGANDCYGRVQYYHPQPTIHSYSGLGLPWYQTPSTIRKPVYKKSPSNLPHQEIPINTTPLSPLPNSGLGLRWFYPPFYQDTRV